jgi:protein-tyrosine kinase
MGKTYEALERAEKEYGQNFLGPQPKARKTPVGQPSKACTPSDLECYQSLKTNLLGRYPDGTIKTILFAGTSHGDGTSTTAINFATTMARDCQLKVLLVDFNFRTPSLHEVFKIDYSLGLTDVLTNGREALSNIERVGPGNLYVLPCGGNRSTPAALFESSRFDTFLKNAREQFEYVIMDAPPVPRFSESRIICARVDGVVLVVGSGKTRRQVALQAKKEIEDAGGKVLGLVLNRRKHYIPEWIYKRL